MNTTTDNESLPVLSKLSTYLAQANIKLRVTEFLGLLLVSTILLAFIGFLFAKAVQVAVVAGVLGAFLPLWYLVRARQIRLRACNDEIDLALKLMADSLRVGYSTVQALEACAEDLRPPVSVEFRRVVDELKIGFSLEEALRHMGVRIGNGHLGSLISSYGVHREIGGNWADLLDKFTSNMRMWRRLAEEAKSLSRPPFRWFVVIATGIVVVNYEAYPGYFNGAWQSAAGKASMAASIALLAVGLLASAAVARELGNLAEEGGDAYRDTSFGPTAVDLAVGGLCLAAALVMGVPSGVLVGIGLIVLTRTGLGQVVAGASVLLIANTLLLTSPGAIGWAGPFFQTVAALPPIVTSELMSLPSWSMAGLALLFAGGLVTISAVAHSQARKRGAVLPGRQLEIHRFRRGDPVPLEHIEFSRSFSSRVVSPLLDWIKKGTHSVFPRSILQRAQERLELAGGPTRVTPSLFVVVQIVFALVLGGLAFSLSQPIWYWLTGLFLVTGYVLPDMWLASRIRSRQREMLHTFPDLLGMLVLCAEADLAFNASMKLVSEKWDHSWGHELSHVLDEIEEGKPRRDALRGMAARLDVAEISQFVTSINSAEQLGVSHVVAMRLAAEAAQSAYRDHIERQIQGRIRHWRPLAALPLLALVLSLVLCILAPLLS